MKTRLIRILKWITLSSIALISIFMVFQRLEIFGNAMINMSFRYDDDKTISFFEGQSVQPEIKYTSLGNNQIRYLILETNPQLPYVFFVHGAPGSLNDYMEYYKDERLVHKINMVSVDRLGYGYSDYGKFEPSLEKQAKVIEKVIKEVCEQHKVIILGHSYGGPIALQLALDNPRSFSHLLLLAPAIDPENEKEVKIASVGASPWTRWLIPPALQVASIEKLNHVKELRKLEPHLNEINTPVCLIHGTKDSLVPYANVTYAREKIDPEYLEVITLEGVDHFLPWTHHDLIVKKTLELLENGK